MPALWTRRPPVIHSLGTAKNRQNARFPREPKPLLTGCGKPWGFSWITRWTTVGKAEDEGWTDVDRLCTRGVLLGKTCGRPGDDLWMKAGDHARSVHRPPNHGTYPWTTRGKPGDGMGMRCGDSFAVHRRSRSIHRPSTAPVYEETGSDLRKQALSTLSTAPITSTAPLLYPRKDPSQVRAWGQRAPSSRPRPRSPHPCPTPAGGWSL